MSFNKNHPERQDDEVFVTNADTMSWYKIGWSTKRRGKIAYDIHGKSLENSWVGGFPVFVKKDEIRACNPEVLKKLEP